MVPSLASAHSQDLASLSRSWQPAEMASEALKYWEKATEPELRAQRGFILGQTGHEPII